MAKYGYGDCSHCGQDVHITKDGRAHRHGYIRIKKGIRRKAMPQFESGKDHHPCSGSGEPTDHTYFI